MDCGRPWTEKHPEEIAEVFRFRHSSVESTTFSAYSLEHSLQQLDALNSILDICCNYANLQHRTVCNTSNKCSAVPT